MSPAPSWAGAITVRPIRSAAQTRAAPRRIETGTTRTCRRPTRARAACGATSPTNPIVPAQATALELSTTLTTRNPSRPGASRRPSNRGVSSSSETRSSSVRRATATPMPTASASATGTTSGMVRP